MKYRGIIFDFNGVMLLDSAWHESAWQKISEKIRGTSLTTEEVQAHVHGRTNKAVFEYLLERPVNVQEFPGLVQEKEGAYRQICLAKGSEFALSPGAEKILDILVREGIPHTIATSSEITNLDFFVSRLGLERWFDREKIAYDDGMITGKPAPDLYLLAAKRLGLPPEAFLAVEDSKSGIESARRAGIGKIIAFGPRESFEELRNIDGVHKVVSRLDEITLADFE